MTRNYTVAVCVGFNVELEKEIKAEQKKRLPYRRATNWNNLALHDSI